MIKKVLSAITAMVLVAAIGIGVSLTTYANSIPQYIKEVKMISASSKEEAQYYLRENGYKTYEVNLRSGVSGNGCYIGYKTTTDPDEAISDIRLMNANGGVNEQKYRDMAAKWKTGVVSSGQYLKEVSLEVKEKYAKGSPLAKAAVELLDVFEVDGVKLSDYLFDSKRTDTDYQDIILICSDNVVTTIYNALALGTADYGGDNFAQRLSKVDASYFDYDTIADSDNEDYAQYWESTSRILTNLQTFGTDYDEAVAFFEDYEPESGSSDNKAPTEAESIKYWKQLVKTNVENSDTESDSYGEENEAVKYASIMAAYEKLSEYPSFSDKYENLAEYIYTCGDPFDEDGNEESDTIIYRIYPLVSVLSDGQLFTLQYSGVSALVEALENNDETYYNQVKAAADEMKSQVKELGYDRVSIFFNVDREIYDKTVAFTDASTAETAAMNNYQELTKKTYKDATERKLISIVLTVAEVACGIMVLYCLFAWIAAAATGLSVGMLVGGVGLAAVISGCGVAAVATAAGTTAGAVVCGIIGVAAIAVVVILIAVILVCLILYFIRQVKKDSIPDEPLPEIPDLIYDVDKKGVFKKYEAVKGLGGNSFDLTGGNGVNDEWDVMYVSYAAEAGDPILAGDQIFVSAEDSFNQPSGTTPVRRFERVDAANLNTFQQNPSHALYLYFYTEASEEEPEETKDEVYLQALRTACGDNKETVRLELTNAGYTVFEENLTPYTDYVSYIGYKTTSNVNDAITDIRVAYYYSEDSFAYGVTDAGVTAKYGKAGTLSTNATIYYTKQKSNGSPILAEFKMSDTLLGPDSGYEGVNMFSGGEAFNFCIGGRVHSTTGNLSITFGDYWGKTNYLYFKPSETFNSSNTEYVSGFAFSTGYHDTLEFASECGFKIIEELKDYNLESGLTTQPIYMVYSTTHNPYRAITDIRTYMANISSASVFENVTYGATGYAACETFVCVENETKAGMDHENIRLLRPSNGFVSRLTYEGNNPNSTDITDQNEAENNLGWYMYVPFMGLYVAGPDSSKTKLTLDDIYFSKEKYDTDRTSFVNSKGETVNCRPVNDFDDCYSTSARNLTFEYARSKKTVNRRYYNCKQYVEFENYLRIYYRGSVSTKGKYIKSIVVASVDPEDNNYNYGYDIAMMKLFSYGEGEIIQSNLSRSRSAQPYYLENFTNSDGVSYQREHIDKGEGKATYVMVTYTNSRLEAMRGMVSKWTDSTADGKSTITVNKANYYSGGNTVLGLSGNYSLYYTRNGMVGSCVTGLKLDGEYFMENGVSIRQDDGSAHLGEDYIIKLQYEKGAVNQYINKIAVARTGSRWDSLYDLYKQGCTACIDWDKNRGLGSKTDYVYLGYAYTTDATDENIITGLQSKSMGSNGDWLNEYTDESDGSVYKKVTYDLNAGVGGDYTYLFYTNSKTQQPIIKIDLWEIMKQDPTVYLGYFYNEWNCTGNLGSGTKSSYIVCFKHLSSQWSISDDATTLTLNGKLTSRNFSNTVTSDGKSAVVPPEWAAYADTVTTLIIGTDTPYIYESAIAGFNNIKTVTVNNDKFWVRSDTTDESVKGFKDGTLIRATSKSIAAFSAKVFKLDLEIISSYGATVIGSPQFIAITGISGVLVACGLAALLIKKKKKKAVVKEDDTQEKED